MFNQLKLEGNGQNIWNARNGLTFCIQVGEESIPDEDPLFINIKNESDVSEPTISVIEKDSDEERDFASHEIVAEIENHIENKGHANSVHSSFNANAKDAPTSWFNIKKRKRSSITRLKRVNKIKNDNGSSKNSLKGINIKNNLVSVILKNMATNQKKLFSDMKIMKNEETGEHVLQSSYIKSDLKESFNIEPWMNDKPNIMKSSKQTLFVLNNARKSFDVSSPVKCNSVNSNDKMAVKSEIVSRLSNMPVVHLVKVESGVAPHIPDSSVENSKVICWEEGNVNKIEKYTSLSEKLKRKYFKSQKADFINSSCFELPDFLSDIHMYESPLANKMGAAPGITVYLSWEAVQTRLEAVQEETMTRFIFDYKTPTFKDDPQPFKKIYLELDTRRKDVDVVIPSNGIPFTFLGVCVYACHLGKKKFNTQLSHEESKTLNTKKIGCPAILSISRIARFPDFDISNLSPSCENEVMKELKDAWDFTSSEVRYYIEYHVREPKSSDHKGHEVQFLVSNNRFKEAVDPRIIEKIRDLTRQGCTGTKIIRQTVDEFIKDELFKGEQNVNLERRRYNPSPRDIRYAITKAKGELKKEGKSVAQLQCSALANEISNMVKDIGQEQYLNQLKYYLTVLWKTVKAQDPLESMFLLSNPVDASISGPAGPTTPKRNVPKKKTDRDVAVVPISVVADGCLISPDQMQDQVIEQFYTSIPGACESNFNLQLYSHEFVDMNPGLVESLQPTTEDDTPTEVYYLYPYGTCELVAPDALPNAPDSN